MHNDESKSVFCIRLRQLREDKDLLQRDVAHALNVSTGAYGLYERGDRQPDPDFIIRFCKFFNVSADYLLGLSDITDSVAPVSIKPTIVRRDSLDDLLPDFRAEAEKYLKYLRTQQAEYLKSTKQEA